MNQSISLFIILLLSMQFSFAKLEVLENIDGLEIEMISMENEILDPKELQWYLLDSQNLDNDLPYQGVSYFSLLDYFRIQGDNTVIIPYQNKEIIVAVIDSGTDINHPDMKGKLWKNFSEIKGQPGVDDDGNGYVDDYYGWNFIGKTINQKDLTESSASLNDDHSLKGIPSANHVGKENLELARNYAFLKNIETISDGQYELNAHWLEQLNNLAQVLQEMKSSNNSEKYTLYKKSIDDNFNKIDEAVKNAKDGTLNILNIVDNYFKNKAINIYNRYNCSNAWPEIVQVSDIENLKLKTIGWYQNILQPAWQGKGPSVLYDHEFTQAREIVGDAKESVYWPTPLNIISSKEMKKFIPLLTKENIKKSRLKVYGNNDVIGIHNGHGTHVSGLIGYKDYSGSNILKLLHNNSIGNIKIMTLRVVPDGDERDIDVANAMIYAIQNGAHYVNMSFGKSHPSLLYDPLNKKIKNGKNLVDIAISLGRNKKWSGNSFETVFVHAAGNSQHDNDITPNFPNRWYSNKKGKIREHRNFIEVGASYKFIRPESNFCGFTKEDAGLVAHFSNFGQNSVDILSPGKNIYSLKSINGDETVDLYRNSSGTSMAAPILTGALAELNSLAPRIKPIDIARIALENRTNIDQRVDVVNHDIARIAAGSLNPLAPNTSYGVFLKDYFINAGIINIKKAYNAVPRGSN
ncbi:S8 family serine peptidase, partial [Bacteriovoracaceae bacterium]|nr:S8 family serine peptidase [Bacteriovoracaceae bacterium]